jgi:hypothetical protein
MWMDGLLVESFFVDFLVEGLYVDGCARQAWDWTVAVVTALANHLASSTASSCCLSLLHISFCFAS